MCKQQQIASDTFVFTSKTCSISMHENETWYTCVLDQNYMLVNNNKQQALSLNLHLHSFNLLMCSIQHFHDDHILFEQQIALCTP